MRNNKLIIILGCCAILFCAASAVTATINEVDCSNIDYDGGTGDFKVGEKHFKKLSISEPLSGRFPHDDPNDSLYLYWAAEYWQFNCWKCMLDTMRMYCEQHPFATKYPGEVLDGIAETWSATTNIPLRSKGDCIDEFNWLVKMQPVNMEGPYQYEIIQTMALCLSSIDINEEANMLYNWSLMFPDSATIASAWREIRIIRAYQKEIPQDTTPFHKLTFPLQPMAGVAPLHSQNINVEMAVVPNPAKLETTVKVSMSDAGLITLEIFDVLGKKIKDVFHGYIENRNIPVDIHDLAQGEYYLRFSYPSGVKTVKLVHEK